MKITILGCGAYGTALATILNENKHNVTMWSAFQDEIDYLIENNESPRLKGIKLKDIEYETNIEKAIKDKDLLIIATPTGAVNEVTNKMKKYYNKTPICAISKGIEQNSCLFVCDIITNNLETEKISVMSGPSFAIDVASKVPIGLTLASNDEETSNIVYKAFANNHFKLQKTNDIIGTEICDAIKNVIAIASGILNGMGYPESSISMLLTESLNDIKKLIIDLKGDEKTTYSFAGIGDLLLTATSKKSRNFSFGNLIGKGASKKEINNYIETTTVEGLYTLKSIKQILENNHIEMPIINIINDIIYNEENPKTLIKYLIERP